MIGYLVEVIRSTLPKMSGYVKTFQKKKMKMKSLQIDDDMLLQKYKIIWTNIEDIKNIELNVLLIYVNKYIKTKIRTYSDKVCTNFCGLNVPEDSVEVGSLTSISIYSVLPYESKYYLQVYIDTCIYKVVNTQMVYYLGNNLFSLISFLNLWIGLINVVLW